MGGKKKELVQNSKLLYGSVDVTGVFLPAHLFQGAGFQFQQPSSCSF